MNIPVSEVFLGDCMDFMAKFPDGFFDLALVDPPYGIGYDVAAAKGSGTRFGNAAAKKKTYKATGWDKEPPPPAYFQELFRVSKNQIIWGANHFIDRVPHPSSCWIVWDKENGANDFADCELAWTSFGTPVRKFRYRWSGMLQENMANKETRIHPTQKPVALYRWLLQNYARPGWKILDTHLGSMSSRIAAYKLGFDFYGAELDPDYYRDGCKRFEEAIRMPLFDAEQGRTDIVQANFFDALDGA